MNNKKNKKELVEELAEKKAALKNVESKAKAKLKKFGIKIENQKTDKLKEVEKTKNEALVEIEKKAKKVWRIFENKQKKITKEAEKAHKDVEKATSAEIKRARNELISAKARVYSTRRKVISFLQLAGVLYLFILSVIVIKEVAFALSAGTVEAIAYTVDNDVSAFGAGWLTTVIVQSGSVVAILANSLVGAKIMSFDIGFYILLGISLGNPLTPVLASLVIRTKDHWHLRRGFELGLANIIYSFFLIIIVLLIEIPTGFFTNSGEVVARWAENFPAFREIPDLLSIITTPLLNLVRFDLWPIPLGIAVGIGLLIFSLGRVGKSVFVFLGGRKHARAIMEKFLGNHWKAFGIGLGLTIIIPSASLLTTIMVPLAIAQIVKLRQAIPYLIGTSVATFIDVLFASFANSQPYAIAGGIVLSMIAAVGVIFIFGNYGCNLIYKTTKYLSTHVIKMRRGNILKYIAAFAIIPLLLILIF